MPGGGSSSTTTATFDMNSRSSRGSESSASSTLCSKSTSVGRRTNGIGHRREAWPSGLHLGRATGWRRAQRELARYGVAPRPGAARLATTPEARRSWAAAQRATRTARRTGPAKARRRSSDVERRLVARLVERAARRRPEAPSSRRSRSPGPRARRGTRRPCPRGLPSSPARRHTSGSARGASTHSDGWTPSSAGGRAKISQPGSLPGSSTCLQPKTSRSTARRRSGSVV